MRYLSNPPLAGRATALAALLCCAAVTAFPAEAQTHPGHGSATMAAAPADGPAAELAKLPPAPSKPDDPAKVAAARAFLIVYQPRQSPAWIAKVLPKFMPKMIEGAKEQNPKVDVKKFVAERTAQILDKTNKSLDQQAHVVSRHFTLQELNGLAAFYRNGLGKRLTDESPMIQRDLRLEARRKMLMSQLPGMEKPAAKPSTPAAMKGPGTPHK